MRDKKTASDWPSSPRKEGWNYSVDCLANQRPFFFPHKNGGKLTQISLLWFSKTQKGDVRAFPAKTSWGTTRPLICQAVNKIIPALLPWAAWPIRGRSVPHKNGGKQRITIYVATCRCTPISRVFWHIDVYMMYIDKALFQVSRWCCIGDTNLGGKKFTMLSRGVLGTYRY